MLNIRPVKRLRVPRYPTQAEALSCPGLLGRLPERWRKCRQAAAAAGLLAAMASTASGCEKPLFGGTPTITSSAIAQETPMYAGAPMPYPTVTEADALKSIRAAADTAFSGLSENHLAGGAGKPIRFVAFNPSEQGYRIVNTNDSDVDLFDALSGVGFEYIDEGDQTDFVIQFTDENVKDLDKEHAYVLVIPAENAADSIVSDADIQKQVKDFIDWLKAESII